MKKLKILHIVSGDLWAGAESQVLTLVSELAKRHHVSVIVLNHGRLATELEALKLDVEVFPESQFGFVKLLYKSWRKVRQYKPDVIHTHRKKEHLIGALANLLSVNAGCVRTVHGAQEFTLSLTQKLQGLIDRWVAVYLQDAVISVSDVLTHDLKNKIPAEKIYTIANGVDPGKVNADAAKHSVDIDPSRINIGIIGRLVRVKRVDLFIQIAHLLCHSNSQTDFQFHIFGDGPLKSSLLELSESFELQNTVTFHGHSDVIPSWLANFDILIMTSDHEGLPMTALESLSLGVPVVAHAVGGLVPLLEEAFPQGLIYSQIPADYDAVVQNILEERPEVKFPSRYSAVANAASVTQIYYTVVS